MNNFSTKIYHTENNKNISDKVQKNSNNIQKQKNTKIFENKIAKNIDSESNKIPQKLDIHENKSSNSINNYNQSRFEILKKDGFCFLDDENEENLHNILWNGFNFTDNAKSSQIGEKSIIVKTDKDQKNSCLFPNILFFDNKVEEKINDFSEEEEIKEIKSDIKLINKNVNTVKKTKKKENIKKESDIADGQKQNIKNNNINNDINEDINRSYLAKGWEDFSFLEQPYSANDNQIQKQLINNSNINNIKNNFIENKWGQNGNCHINTKVINENSSTNIYQNFDNRNYLMNNIIQNNLINLNQIFQNQYNNQLNNQQNPYIQNIIINNIIIQNLTKQNMILQNFNYQNFINFDNQNLNNPVLKKIINKNNLIDITNIKLGLEKRTTIRMMNIPTHFNTCELSAAIDKRFNIDSKKENRTYNYIYVPGSMKSTSKNIGFAFINFVHPLHIIKFYEFYHKRNLRTFKSNKICLITFADKQIMKGNFGNDINPYGNYLIFSDTKNHFLSFDK